MPDQRRLVDIVEYAGKGLGRGPLHRAVVDAATWETLAVELAGNRNWSLLAHWAEPDAVHLALLDAFDNTTAVATLPCPAQRYPSLGRHHPPAIRLERSIRDLYGLEPEHAPDPRPWLDHGRWDTRHPLARQPDAPATPPPYPFLTAEGHGLHQIAVGPVHAGIIEPGHFRFSANGETVVRLEERLGYVHKGIESLWRGSEIGNAARLAARVSGDSTVASSIAFAHALEAALGVSRTRARAMVACVDGRTRAHRQPSRRHRCRLQRRVVHADARALRRAARTRAARMPYGVRPPSDDGPRHTRRRLHRSFTRRDRGDPARRRRDCTALSEARRAVRRHAIASGPNGRHRRAVPGTRHAIRRRRIHRPRVGPRVRRAARPPLRPVRRVDVRSSAADERRRQRTGVDTHPRSRPESGADSPDHRPASTVARRVDRQHPRAAQCRPSARVARWSKGSAATSSRGFGSTSTGASRVVICATRRGFNGRFSKP